MEQHDLLSNDLLLTEHSQVSLGVAAKWGKFLAIVGFVFCGCMVIGGISLQAFPPSNITVGYGSEFPKYVGITYAIMAVILFFPCLYLLRFSNKIQDAIKTISQESFDSAFMNLKSMFKFYGVFTIIMLIFFILAILGVIATTIMR